MTGSVPGDQDLTPYDPETLDQTIPQYEEDYTADTLSDQNTATHTTPGLGAVPDDVPVYSEEYYN